jgi:hypothetical protein
MLQELQSPWLIRLQKRLPLRRIVIAGGPGVAPRCAASAASAGEFLPKHSSGVLSRLRLRRKAARPAVIYRNAALIEHHCSCVYLVAGMEGHARQSHRRAPRRISSARHSQQTSAELSGLAFAAYFPGTLAGAPPFGAAASGAFCGAASAGFSSVEAAALRLRSAAFCSSSCFLAFSSSACASVT